MVVQSDVDKTNQSYYGETKLHYLTVVGTHEVRRAFNVGPTVSEGTVAPVHVEAARILESGDIGPHRSQDRAAQGTGEHVGDLDDP